MWGGESDLNCRVVREMGLMFNEDWRPPIEESDYWNNRLQFGWDLNILFWLVAGVVRGPWNYSKLRPGWLCLVVNEREKTNLDPFIPSTQCSEKEEFVFVRANRNRIDLNVNPSKSQFTPPSAAYTLSLQTSATAVFYLQSLVRD